MDNKDNKDNKDNIDYLDYLYNIKTIITNYLIDDEITINDDDDDDDIIMKCKKYVLKYKRIIGLICLIILIIIGYHCNPYNIHYNNDTNHDTNNITNDKQIQNGGAGAAAAAAKASAAAARKTELKGIAAQGKADRQAAKVKAADDKAAAKKTKQDEKAAGPGKLEKASARGQAKIDAHKQSAKDFKKKALSLKTYTNAAGAASDAAGRLVTENADLVFQILYSVAIFILICIVTIPAIAFIVVGIICYVLLKPKMAALKAL
jgi:hypothetical protein